ncbi:ElyC/SanA/YdcF family protein [Chamaesiphon sp.]|uniref:ElyC/SanA/YdcF family protein n=1 Tax=Chamaesiphon sp. TaxID=2814140 RepID=UPI003594919E
MLITTFCIHIEGREIVAFVFSTICIAAAISLTILNLHNFLAKSSPIIADILVVEGWLPDYALQSAATEFKNGAYQKLITIGGAIPRGFYLSEYANFAELSAATLIALGVEPQHLLIIADLSHSPGRTSSSAMTIAQWLATSELQITSLNLFTLGTHARRSWLLFKDILEPKISIGIIAGEPLNYNPKSWWHSSEGIRTVISELLAYLSVRIFNI